MVTKELIEIMRTIFSWGIRGVIGIRHFRVTTKTEKQFSEFTNSEPEITYALGKHDF